MTLLRLCPITEHMAKRLRQFEVIEPDELPGRETAVRSVLTDGHIGIPGDLMARLPALEIISCYGVGYDNVAVDAAVDRGIVVCHTPDVLTEEVATTALLLYLGIWRNFEAQSHQARSGRWAQEGSLPLSRTADGRTVGILGLGRIGKAIARKLEAFGATILYHGRHPQEVDYDYAPDLTEMARRSETLICAAPGDASTRHLINRAVLDALGPDGVLINVGRGATVDEAALIDALEDGRLGGAALDVFETEPHIPDRLRALSNVILTPHIGSATVETRKAMGDLALDNLLAAREGRPVLTPIPECRHLAKI